MEHPFKTYPKHLYHATDAPRIVYGKEDEDKARKDGYGDNYIHQGPKYTKAELADKAGGVYDEATDTVTFPVAK